MLYKPSEIMAKSHVRTQEEYGVDVYKKLLVKLDGFKSGSVSTDFMFSSCFVDKADADRCYESIDKRLKKSLEPSSVEVDYVFLPPLFIRSNADEIALLSNVILVFCKSGPVIPVAFSENNQTLHGDEKLPNLIIKLYQISCSEYVDSSLLKTLISK